MQVLKINKMCSDFGGNMPWLCLSLGQLKSCFRRKKLQHLMCCRWNVCWSVIILRNLLCSTKNSGCVFKSTSSALKNFWWCFFFLGFTAKFIYIENKLTQQNKLTSFQFLRRCCLPQVKLRLKQKSLYITVH